MSKLKISQSLINAYLRYKDGEECGEFIKLVYIDLTAKTKSSTSMEMGTRFEYEALGNLNYDGQVPMAFMNQNGSVSAKQILITQQATFFKEWMINEGNTIISRGERVEVELEEFILSVMRDLIFEDADGNRILCDLKMSGNLDNKESEWGWHEDTLLNHQNKVIQMMTYTLVDVLNGHDPKAFVFYVASSQKAGKFKPFRITIKKETLAEWTKKIYEWCKQIVFEYEVTGFTAMPGARCTDCPAKDICKRKDEKAAKSSYVNLIF